MGTLIKTSIMITLLLTSSLLVLTATEAHPQYWDTQQYRYDALSLSAQPSSAQPSPLSINDPDYHQKWASAILEDALAPADPAPADPAPAVVTERKIDLQFLNSPLFKRLTAAGQLDC